MDLVPRLASYYELAPLLFKLSKANNFAAKASKEFLKQLTLSEIVDSKNVTKRINMNDSCSNYQICEDKFTNFVLNFMLTTNRSWEDTKTKLPWDQTLAPNSVI